MSIFNANKFRTNLQRYLQVKFQNYKLEAEERLISVIVAIIITFVLLVTLSIIFLFLNIAIAQYLNEIYEQEYWGYLIIVFIHLVGFLILLLLLSFKKARVAMYHGLTRVIQPFFNFILKKILRQAEEEHKQHETEIQHILTNKKLNRDEKQKQLSYIEERYEQELGESLKSVQKSISNVIVTSVVSYVSFRLLKRAIVGKKKKQQVIVTHTKQTNKKEKQGNELIRGIKKQVTNMAVNTILDTVSEKVQKSMQNQMRKNDKNEK